MKVIFLSHQGVMCLKKQTKNSSNLDPFDKEAIDILNYILEKDKEIEIVVTSDLKYCITLEEMKMFYEKEGIKKVPIDYTPRTDNYISNIIHIQRALEIQKWLYKKDISHWVCVDSLDMSEFLDNFIYISNPILGIKEDDVKEKILKHLL